MSAIPQSHADILQSKAFAFLATVNADGTPQVTPVWFDYEGGQVIFNTAKGRLKDRNLRRDPHVAVAIMDPNNAYRYLQVRGTATPMEEGADAMIDRLAKKYLGVDKYPYAQPGEQRVTYRITPEQAQVMG